MNTFAKLHFYKFTFRLRVTETIVFSEIFKGLSLRNSIKTVFHKEFDRRILTEVFDKILEPGISGKLNIGSKPPRFYILEPEITPKMKYLPGEFFYINLILIGNGIEYIEYFKQAIYLLGKKYWLGRKSGYGRGNFEIDAVIERDKYSFSFDSFAASYKNYEPVYLKDISSSKHYKRVLLHFFSPTCIIPENDTKPAVINRANDLKLFIDILYRRLSQLQFLYCGEENYIYKHTLKNDLKISGSEFNWHRYEIGKEKFEGFTGKLEITGNLENLIDLLVLGEHLHVGKDTPYGFGKYEILN